MPQGCVTVFLPALVAVLAAAFSGCGLLDTAEPDLADIAYLQPGTEFWDGWKVPTGTVGIAAPFPEPDSRPVEGMPEDPDRVEVDFLVTGDPHQVIRDLHAQITRHELRPVMPREYDSACDQHRDRYMCRLYGQADGGLTKLAAELEIDESPKPGDVWARLQMHIGEYHYLDATPGYSRPSPVLPMPTRSRGGNSPVPVKPPRPGGPWVDTMPPEGKAPVSIPSIDAKALGPGADLPLFGTRKTLGTVPEGSRLLAPPYQAAATYGFGGTFVITERHDEVLAELEAMAAETATGERNPDTELTAGDLAAHHISYDGSGGGCGSALDLIDLSSGVVAARLTITCD